MLLIGDAVGEGRREIQTLTLSDYIKRKQPLPSSEISHT